MKAIEDRLAPDLERLCAGKPRKPGSDDKRGGEAAVRSAFYRRTDRDAGRGNRLPAVAEGLDALPRARIGCARSKPRGPKPMRSILDVIEAQSRHIVDIRTKLESARVALTERKTIEPRRRDTAEEKPPAAEGTRSTVDAPPDGDEAERADERGRGGDPQHWRILRG